MRELPDRTRQIAVTAGRGFFFLGCRTMGMSGEDWRMVILGAIAALQAIAIVVIPLLIQRGRKEQLAATTEAKATLNTVHTIVNSRYDALVAELAAKQAVIDQLKAPAAP